MPSHSNATMDRATAQHMAERMLVMRRFEETTLELYQRKLIPGMYHLYIGQEAGGSAILDALDDADKLLTNHRGHGHVVGRGSDPGRSFSELLGKANGLTGGRGGSVHMCDPERGFLISSAILGSNISLALGAGYAIQRSGRKEVAVVFFGDASLEEGITYEVMNIAAMRKLPVLFALENNNPGAIALHEGGYSASNSVLQQFTRIPELFGVKTVQLLAGDDLATKLARAREAVAYCRAGSGPVFCELQSVHWPGSNMVFAQMLTGVMDLRMAWGEREPEGEHAGWVRDHDPVLRMAREFIAGGLMGKDELLALDRRVCQEMERAARFAIDSPLPEAQSAYRHVFA